MLNRNEKDIIIHTAGFIGHLENTNLGSKDKKNFMIKELDKLLAEFVKASKSNPKDINRLLKDLDKKKYEICVFTNEDRARKLREKQSSLIQIKLEELNTLAEHSIQFCRGCKRNISKCALRKVLKNLKIPPSDYEYEKSWGVCEYDQDV